MKLWPVWASVALCATIFAAPTARAQADDPAIAVCEAREMPRPDPSTYRRVAALVRLNVAVVVFETLDASGKPQTKVARCPFALDPWGKTWSFAPDAEETELLQSCEKLKGAVVAVVRSGGEQQARSAIPALEKCVALYKQQANREAALLLIKMTASPRYSYPIEPSVTALRLP